MEENLWHELVAAGLSQEAPEAEWLQSILPIIAVPRTSNLALLASVVERFIPSQAEETALAYIAWIPRINTFADGLFVWDLGRGYILRADIREILLRVVRSDPSFPQINRFIAELWERYALVSSNDDPRHIVEMLYHLLLSAQQLVVEQAAEKV